MAGSELLDANNRSLSRAVDVQSKLSLHTHVTDGFISFDTATKELPTAICKWGHAKRAENCWNDCRQDTEGAYPENSVCVIISPTLH